jgi:uncharacterized 2Fe-2S/4Fe-4S cluster protein (DUF4445 family)
MTIHVDFEPVGRRGECPAGGTLLDSARHLGVELVNLSTAWPVGQCRWATARCASRPNR